MIKKNNILEIYFVLSSDNCILLDALGKQYFLAVRGLDNFYYEITGHKERSEASWETHNHQFSILSYFLNKKINELQFELNRLFIDQVKIGGKIYNKQEHIFTNIYSDLICRDFISLN